MLKAGGGKLQGLEDFGMTTQRSESTYAKPHLATNKRNHLIAWPGIFANALNRGLPLKYTFSQPEKDSSMFQSILKALRHLGYAMLLTLSCITGIASWAQTQYPAEPDKPWKERTWQDRSFNGSYKDWNSNKHGKTFFADPFIWAYTQEFADRFRMPQEWVDHDLKGALAVAWRVSTIDQQMCGLAGDPQNCWPVLTCLMDIYFDSNAPLPWRYDEPRRDNFMRGISSTDYLPRLSENSPAMRYLLGRTKGPPVLNGALNYPSGARYNGPEPGYFDRQIEPGVSLIGFTQACPHPIEKGPAWIRFFSQEEEDRTRGYIEQYAHTVTFSEAYIKKIRDVFQIANKSNDDKAKQILRDFIESQKNK